MHVTAIIAAAGAGRRLGAAKPKQLLDIGGGSMLQHSVRAFLGHPRVADVVVVLSPDLTTLALAGIEPSRAAALRVVKGGDRRQDSVANGFAAVAPESDVVFIHDAFEFKGFLTRNADHFSAFVASKFVSFVEFFLVKVQSGGTQGAVDHKYVLCFLPPRIDVAVLGH